MEKKRKKSRGNLIRGRGLFSKYCNVHVFDFFFFSEKENNINIEYIDIRTAKLIPKCLVCTS